MRTLFTSLFLLLLINLFAANNIQLEHYNAVPQNKTVFIEMPFSSAFILNPSQIEVLKNVKVEEVTYVYSRYKESKAFVQNDLDKERLNELEKWVNIPDSVQWNIVEQTACSDKACAQELFHGFVVRYEPILPLHSSNLKQQLYTINNECLNHLVGEYGTEVAIQPGAFVDENGNPIEGPVTIELREALTMEDILMANLHTMTAKGRVLESDGMIYLDARANGKEVDLRDDESVEIRIPSADRKNQMSLFTGVDDSTGNVKWVMPKPFKTQIKLTYVLKAKKVTYAYVRRGEVFKDFYLTYNYFRDSTRGKENFKFTNGNFGGEHAIQANMKAEEYAFVRKLFRENTIPSPNPFQASARKQDSVVVQVKEQLVPRSAVARAYVAGISGMGWFNVDRLLKRGNSSGTEVLVKVNGVDKELYSQAVLMIPSMKVMIGGNIKENGEVDYSYYGGRSILPRGKEAVLVNIQTNGEDVFQVGVKKIILGQNDRELMSFQNVSEDEMMKKIKQAI